MKETAEDILNKHSTDTTTKGRVRFAEALAAMEEYSLLKSKEAAEKTWEASSKRARWELDMALGIGDKYESVPERNLYERTI